MDDVFDSSPEDNKADLVLGSRDWLQRKQVIQLSAERDAIFAAREQRLQLQFECGVHEGFRMASKIATLRGRLMVRAKFSLQEHKEAIEAVITEIDEVQDKLIASFSENGYTTDPVVSECIRKAELLLGSCTKYPNYSSD
ncbi:hypothetical protein T265_00141 [Opisthorchis viverrini]|uniref:Uncharacterized protein n=2 Tax=Opisthorchis viverrini TaxID=6198 RepID=A0A075A4J7_OPIVI|nr:hypothetical protein T265_00141 [Opisthorchis viverrini]KER34296.1 hypothetical protein T265_00141 [Opisthorchis viverrini]